MLVVGSGPAGSSAAKSTAEKGLSTILIEKNIGAGMNIQCAETISKYLTDKLPFSIPSKFLNWSLDGMYFSTGDFNVFNTSELWQGHNISRTVFDKWLVDEAVAAGVKFYGDSKLVDLNFDDDFNVKSAVVRKEGKPIEIFPKCIIAADGVYSTVARRLGVFNPPKNGIGKVIAYDVDFLNLKYSKFDQIFFGDFAMGAYAYIMPKNSSTAGIGVGTSLDVNKSKLESFFSEFTSLPEVKNQISKMKIIDEKSGDAPVASSIERLIYGNVLFCGDAANQNIKPFLEGIQPGIICGNITGEYVAEVLKGKKSFDNAKLEDRINSKLPILQDSQGLCNLIQGKETVNKKLIHLINLGIFSGRLDVSDLTKINKMSKNELKEFLSRIKE